MKVLTLLGTRPEIIRLSRIMATLDDFVDHIVVHTGQNYDYELSQIFFDDLALRKPDHFLDAANLSTASTVGLIISKTDDVFAAEKPDAVVILGESNSCLGAYAAKRRKIPVFHIDAGKRSYDQRVPEEINRRLIDAIADVNMPCSSIARDNLLHEGFPSDRIFQIGTPMKEVFSFYRDKIESSDALKRLGLRPGEYFVVSAHREENVDDPEQLQQLVTTLNNLAKYEKKRVVFSVHPRTRKRLETGNYTLDPLIQTLRPLGFHDYNALQRDAYAVLSDSGAIDEESTLLNFYALNLRNTRERYEMDDSPGAIMTGVGWERVFDSLKIVKRRRETSPRPFATTKWENDFVSQKVAQTVVSYADYVDRFVWHKK